MSTPTSTVSPAILNAELRAFLDELVQADTPGRQAVRDSRPSPSTDFPTGDIVRFLPEVCHIKATADQGAVFNTAMLLTTQPIWSRATFRHLVGLADDTAPSYPHTRQAKVPTAGGEVFLYPKLSKPYYSLKSITNNGVPKANVIFIDQYATESSRLELARKLIIDSILAAKQQRDTITTAMCQWRCDRRQWELDLVVNEWKHGDMKCLSPKLDLVHLVDAKAFVLRENKKDQAGLVNTFFTGRYKQTMTGKPIIADGDDGGHFTDSFLPLHNELNDIKMDALLNDLQQLIDSLKAQSLSPANAMFTPVKPNNGQNPAAASGSNKKRPGDDLLGPNAKRVTRSQTRDSRMMEAVYQTWPLLRPPAVASTSISTSASAPGEASTNTDTDHANAGESLNPPTATSAPSPAPALINATALLLIAAVHAHAQAASSVSPFGSTALPTSSPAPTTSTVATPLDTVTSTVTPAPASSMALTISPSFVVDLTTDTTSEWPNEELIAPNALTISPSFVVDLTTDTMPEWPDELD